MCDAKRVSIHKVKTEWIIEKEHMCPIKKHMEKKCLKSPFQATQTGRNINWHTDTLVLLFIGSSFCAIKTCIKGSRRSFF